MKKNEKRSEEKKKRSLYERLNYQQKRTFWGIVFLLPWVIGCLAFFLGPLVKTFYYSFFEMKLVTGGFEYTYVGTQNFKYALTVDPDYYQDLLEALASVAKNVPIQVFITLFIAIMLNGKYPGRGFFRMIFFIPIILSTGITTIELTGVSVAPETSQTFINAEALIGVIRAAGIPSSALGLILEYVDSIFEVITTAGVQILIFLSGLQGISPTLYEVAQIEGCTRFESFCKITLPMISPMILVCTVYSLAENFAKAEISKTINSVTFTSGKYGLGAAMSAIYFLVSMAVILIVSGAISKGVFYYDK